uniref:head GIN domain-containing protein n=1 Tax=Sphingomonas bacterium TaxID=1895847 RepID=UPI0026150189|nr:head GIN domain-containing protein [Sphingomonas bacterium]
MTAKGCDAGRMIARLLAFALLCLPFTAQAAEHRYAFGSYDRVRIEGPFEVNITTGVPPGALASGDARLIDGLDIAVQGSTLIVRMGHQGWGETPVGAAAARPVITLTTPALNAAFVNGGARVKIQGMKAQRVDLSVNGSGTVTVNGADTDQLFATIIGAGTMTLSGRAARARLVTNGAGNVDATGLNVNDLSVLQDGTGETRAAARYTAQVNSTGLGHVVVAGRPKCLVHAAAGGPVECGGP